MRVLQELIAASWVDTEVAKVVRAGLMGWFELIAGAGAQGREGARRPRPLLGRGGRAPLSATPSSARESLYLLGFEKKGSPVRQALRRVGDLIRTPEARPSAR